ncbi:hypothetical protein D9757_013266 [Collybiopsis confluens]|uniref:Uncharacterized protein n=1 Tax=Collybiopsis confluens TaxID=2823264 RepID=A0A8H5D3P5_9AGAR|nr:hypothetical protein D9757_013266 [Collybiopsis confluens]
MKHLGQVSSIAQVILIDGLLYFLLMLIIGIISVILSLIQLLTPGTNKITTVSLIISPFFDVLPNLLISRLVLNLSNFYSMEEANLSNNRTISGLQFATNRILGNIGAPLHISVEEPEECSASDELENFDLDWS